MASDHCTNPIEYTIDKRCYVTDKQKQQKPYNAVVKLVEFGFADYCTGTLAKLEDVSNDMSVSKYEVLYLFTARHCVTRFTKNRPSGYVTIKLQNGKFLAIDSLIDYGKNFDEDWVVYRLPIVGADADLPYVYMNINGQTGDGLVTSAGYGRLKIMNDKEIEIFRQKYLDFLKKRGITDVNENVGVYADGDIDIYNDKVRSFVYNLSNVFYSLDIFNDNKLKFSRCVLSDEPGCQSWRGDSGGPLFDEKNRLVGVQSMGYTTIGGPYHAASADYVPVEKIYKSLMDKRNETNSID